MINPSYFGLQDVTSSSELIKEGVILEAGATTKEPIRVFIIIIMLSISILLESHACKIRACLL